MSGLFKKSPGKVHALTPINIVLYLIASGLYNGNAEYIAVILLILSVALSALVVIAESGVVLQAKKIHKVIALFAIPLNLIMAGFSYLAIIVSGL